VPKIGEAVPNISWTTINGEKIDLNQFRDSWVLLCYWCSCQRHRNEILSIQSVYDALYDKNLKIVVIDDTDIDHIGIEEFAKKSKLPFYIVEDSQESIKKLPSPRIGVRPVYFLIDMNGRLHSTSLNFGASIDNAINLLTDVIKVKIDDIAITNITEHGATIRCRTNKAVPCWLENYHQFGISRIQSEQGTNHLWILDNESPDITNTFKVATNGLANTENLSHTSVDNTTSRSSEFSFTTLTDGVTNAYKDDVAAINISNAVISNITGTSAELNWETNKEATSVATLAPYDTVPITKFREDTSFKKQHALLVANLEPQTLYDVHIQSEDINGRFDTYDLGFVTQPPNYANRTKIFNISITDITDSGATISWSTDRPAFCNICTSLNCGMEWLMVKTPNINHTWAFSKLTPDTEYWVQIQTNKTSTDRFNITWPIGVDTVSDVFNFKTLKAMARVDMK
jgi:peroxiredoxin